MNQSLIGQQFGNYLLVRRLGGGGFADVYLGQHVRVASQQAAIKLLHLSAVNEQAFLQEAERTASLRHPHIVRLYDFDIQQGTPFLVLEYVPNGSLARHKGQQLPLETIIPYVKQIAPTLQYAHDRNVIHRDIKPDNILVDAQGELLISDFGIVVLSQTGVTSLQSAQSVGGMPYYMAPEMFQGKPQQASDQYALAIMVYAWLCGKPPFTEGDFTGLGYQHTHEPVPSLREQNPMISEEVEEVILTALSKDPGQRFGNIGAFAHALEEASQPKSTQTTTRQLPPQPIMQQPQSSSVSLTIPAEPLNRGVPKSDADTPPVFPTQGSTLPIPLSQSMPATVPVTSSLPMRRAVPPSIRPQRFSPGKRMLLLGSILLVLILGSTVIFYWRAKGNTLTTDATTATPGQTPTHGPTAVLSAWQEGPPLPTARDGLAAVVGPDGRIYAIGGWNGSNSLNTVEVYDPQTKQWSTGAPMPTARNDLAAVVGPDHRIYAIGGGDGSNDLNAVEIYDPQTGKWSTGAPMPTARAWLAAVVGPDHRIYAIGGWKYRNALNTVEVYDP